MGPTSRPIPLDHHEKFNGGGYPFGIAGKQIPFQARLFTVVDVWDALKSSRPYRKAWSEPKVMDYLSSRSGVDFDPRVVKAFLNLQEEQS